MKSNKVNQIEQFFRLIKSSKKNKETILSNKKTLAAETFKDYARNAAKRKESSYFRECKCDIKSYNYLLSII